MWTDMIFAVYAHSYPTGFLQLNRVITAKILKKKIKNPADNR